MLIVTAITTFVLVASAAITIKVLRTPLGIQEDEKALYYKSLVEHGVSLSEAMLQSRFKPIDQIIDTHEALKTWEQKVKQVSHEARSDAVIRKGNYKL